MRKGDLRRAKSYGRNERKGEKLSGMKLSEEKKRVSRQEVM